MAKVEIVNVLGHLDSKIRRALEETIREYFPEKIFDDREVFKTFKKKISKRCSNWEIVPDHYIEKD